MLKAFIEHEELVRVGDPTRITLQNIFKTPDEEAINKVEISPEEVTLLPVYYDVTTSADDSGRQFIDYVYSSDGVKTINVKITTEEVGFVPIVEEVTISVLAEEDDLIFSNDTDLVAIEDSIKTYLREGRSTFLDKHRRARDQILYELDAKRMWKDDGSKYAVEDIVDLLEFREWSTFQVLVNIFQAEILQPDDVYSKKADRYSMLLEHAKGKSFFRLDKNGDGTIDEGSEKIDNHSGSIFRR